MKRHGRVTAAAAALCVLGLGALVLPATAGASKVANPGVFSLSAVTGQIRIGNVLDLDLTPNPLPQCSDGIDNDGDGKIDLLDNQCAPGPQGQPAAWDDSELVPGFQPKVDVDITGTIDADGNIEVPAANVIFPPAYLELVNPFNGQKAFVTAQVLATAPTTGSLDPTTGAAVLDVRARVRLSGNLWGNPLSSNCSIGTAANPIALNLITGNKPNVGGFVNSLTGTPYNTTTGLALLVDNAFVVPGASSCVANGINLNQTINDQVGLPSGLGRNAIAIFGRTDPVITAAGGTTTTTSTTSTTAPTTSSTTSTSTTTSTTSTTTSTTTTSTTSTTTTSTTTTTTAPTTTSTTVPTTTTTPPQPSDDSVSVRVSGAVSYENAGTGNGDIVVRRDANGIVRVGGFLDVPGTDGGTARVAVSAQRAWLLPLWTGQVSVRDEGAGVGVSVPIFGQIGSAGVPGSARGTSSWFLPGQFPNLVRPLTVSWTVVDAG